MERNNDKIEETRETCAANRENIENWQENVAKMQGIYQKKQP